MKTIYLESSGQKSGKGAIVTDEDWGSSLPESDYILIIDRCVIKNNTIIANANTYGAGLYISKPARITNNLIVNNEAICTANTGTQQLGTGVFVGLQSRHDNNGNEIFGRTYIINNTIANNIQRYSNGNLNDRGGGLWFNEDGGLNGEFWFFNNVIWGNESGGQRNINDNLPGSIYIDHNDIQFSSEDPWFDGTTMYDVDPVFVDSTNNNFKLSNASPVIGAGDAEFEGQSAPGKDLLGNSRPAPSGSSPDLGAYENSLAESPYPKQVKNVTATIGSQSVNLIWDANSETDIEKYVIYMSEISGFEPAKKDSIGESATNSFSATGLTNKILYHVRVAAVDSSGYRGSFSEIIDVIPSYQGPNWWISQNGNDGDGDGTQENPFNSIVWPFHNTEGNNDGFFSDGDTIRLMKGSYITVGGISINNGNISIGDGGNYNNVNLTNFTIIGDSDDPNDVRVQGGDLGPHFQLGNIKATFRNITFVNGFSGDRGGSIKAEQGELNFYNCIFEGNESNEGGAAVALLGTNASFSNVEFRDNVVMKGDQSGNWGGGAVLFSPAGSDDYIWEVTFNTCLFTNNGIYVTSSSNQGAEGGVFSIDDDDVRVSVLNSEFRQNYVNSPNYNFGAILRIIPFSPDNWGSMPVTEFIACKFIENTHQNNGNSQSRGLLFDVGSGLQVTNSLFTKILQFFHHN